MIRINLLPVRAAKKKETAVQQIVIFCVSLAVVLVIVGIAYGVRLGQIASTRNDITAANGKINELKAKIGKLEELKTLKEQVRKKLDVLSQLRKNKTGPAQRLATISDITPEQLWLTGYAETGNDVKVSGKAYSEELIAQFMRSIQATEHYMGVELIESLQIDEAGTKLKSFQLGFKLKNEATVQAQQAPEAKK
jgi:type IV pilus assembly protein PilN